VTARHLPGPVLQGRILLDANSLKRMQMGWIPDAYSKFH
jgi:hypothetical protein